MHNTQTIKDIATIASEVAHLKQALEDSEKSCLERDNKAVERIKVLESYKARTEKYGWFLLGMATIGAMLAAGMEKIVNTIFKVIQ